MRKTIKSVCSLNTCTYLFRTVFLCKRIMLPKLNYMKKEFHTASQHKLISVFFTEIDKHERPGPEYSKHNKHIMVASLCWSRVQWILQCGQLFYDSCFNFDLSPKSSLV